MSSIVLQILIALLLLAANAFFVAAEFALVKSRGFRVRTMVEQRRFGAQLVREIMGNIEAYLACCQLGITMASLGLGWVGEPVVAALLQPLLEPLGLPEKALHFTSFLTGFLVFSSLHIVIGEQVPKTFAIRQPMPVSQWIAYPLYASYLVFYPLNWLLNTASRGILSLFGVQESSLVLGKLSGRHAFKDKLASLGYELEDAAFVDAFKRFKDLADKKKHVFDEDIIALVDDEIMRGHDAIVVKSLKVETGTGIKPTATMTLSVKGEDRNATTQGDGPVDVRPGAFAEYMVTLDSCLYHKPANLSFNAACLTEPLSGAWKGVIQYSEMTLAEDVVIIGVGSIGLLCMMVAKAAGVVRLIAIDTSEYAGRQALALGATHVVNPAKEDAVKRVYEIIPDGPDVIVEAAGPIEAVRLMVALRRHPEVRQRLAGLERDVESGALPPSTAARRILATFLGR